MRTERNIQQLFQVSISKDKRSGKDMPGRSQHCTDIAPSTAFQSGPPIVLGTSASDPRVGSFYGYGSLDHKAYSSRASKVGKAVLREACTNIPPFTLFKPGPFMVLWTTSSAPAVGVRVSVQRNTKLTAAGTLGLQKSRQCVHGPAATFLIWVTYCVGVLCLTSSQPLGLR